MRRGVLLTAITVSGYGLFACWVFRPTASILAHTLPAFHGLVGDALFHTWATSYVSRKLLTDPLHLFDAGIFYPARHTLAYGDHMIGEGVLGLPIWLATHNPLLEFNVISLAAFVLCGATAFRYRRETGGGLAGAVASGLVFSFTPFRLNSPTWPQVLLTFAMPLAVAAWFRWVRDRRTRDFVAWIAWWVVHSLMGLYVAFYFAVTMGVLALVAIARASRADRWRLLWGSAGAALASGLLLAPTLWPYVFLRTSQGHVRTIGLGTDWTFLLPGPGTWSGAIAGFDGRIQGTIVSFGPGFFTTLVVLVGIVVARRHARDGRERLLWWANALGLAIALIIMFVPIDLQLRIPGFDMLRMSNRAFHVGLLFVAWFAGAAVDAGVAVTRSPSMRVAVGVTLSTLLALDTGAAPRERLRMPIAGDLPPIYAAVRAMPDQVLYERTDEIEGAARAVYFSIFHEKTLVNGYSGFTSPGPAFVIQRLFDFPAAPARATMAALGVHAVLLHETSPGALDRRLDGLPSGVGRELARDGGTALVRIDEASASPPPPAVPLSRAGWTLEASGAHRTLSALIDGDGRTVWRLPTEPGKIPSLTIDLGAAQLIAGVQCTPGSTEATGVYLAEVATSLDQVTWTPTESRFDPDALATLFARPADVRFWEARFPSRDARWVRLTNARAAFRAVPWEIAELDVLRTVDESVR